MKQYYEVLFLSYTPQDDQSMRGLLGVDHLIFDGGGCENPKKNIKHMFLVKKKILAEFLRRKKKSSSLNLGVAKDFA